MTELKIMRILREVNKYSQEYVASILDINQNTYSKLENGQIKLTIERMRKLAELYDISPDYFLGEELPVINYNTGPNSHGGPIKTYNNSSCIDNNLWEKILSERDKLIDEKNVQIDYLKKELEYCRKEKEELLKIISNKHIENSAQF